MQKRKNNNNSNNKLKVLVAPLNWGLGHVTRCIPIIKEIQNQHCEVILAANDDIYFLLKKEFPTTKILPLFGYNIKYSRKSKLFLFKLLLQLPSLMLTISKEYRWLQKAIIKYQPDIVISDNRFGMYNPGLFSIYITHQLSIKTGNFFSDRMARFIHDQFIKKYDQCWVPDFKENGLAGELSHPQKLQKNAIYIGALSRFENMTVGDKIYNLFVSISGPEPQRTIFENIILDQLNFFEKTALVVRGLPAETQNITSQNSFLTIVNHLSAKDMNQAFLQSEMIICRSGYTTIMDLIKIRKKAILVPTPGQPEQEYLASYLMGKKNFFSVKQKNFKLVDALLKAAEFPFLMRADDMDTYKTIIAEFILNVKSQKNLQCNNNLQNF
ncbi:MAG: glycosyltransferase [Ginsengibacter sp.]